MAVDGDGRRDVSHSGRNAITDAGSSQTERAAQADVAVLIACYNQSRFLPDAIESTLSQTVPPAEIIVVDDGSTDETAEVATRYQQIRYIRQHNQGLSAARNSGLRASKAGYLIFLDADDRLLPNAVADGLSCLRAHPCHASAYGHFRYIDDDGRPLFEPNRPSTSPNPNLYLALLHRNVIAMHATVIYRRSALEEIGEFDVSLRACEDYDMYLRLARRYPAAQHQSLVAEYRLHDGSMSRDPTLMLRHSISVLRRERPYVKGRPPYAEAYREGIAFWQHYYGDQLVVEIVRNIRKRRNWGEVARGIGCLLRYDRPGAVSLGARALRRGNHVARSWFGYV